MQDLARCFAGHGLVFFFCGAGFEDGAHGAFDEGLQFDVGSGVLVVVQKDQLGEGAG